jgi:hypothetical protein
MPAPRSAALNGIRTKWRGWGHPPARSGLAMMPTGKKAGGGPDSSANAHGLTYHPMPDGGDNAWLGIQRFSPWPETRRGRLLHASSSPFAVLRLIASSNLTGAWTGSSLGFAPFDVDDEEARRAGSIRLHVPVNLSRNSSPPFFSPLGLCGWGMKLATAQLNQIGRQRD